MKVGAVIMASGFSARMGENKLLMKYRGKALAEHVMDAVAGAGFAEIIVVTCHSAVAEMARRRHLTVVENDHPELGQSRSVVLGTQAALAWGPGAREGVADREASGTGVVDREAAGKGAAGREAARMGVADREAAGKGAANHDSAGAGLAGLMFFPADMPFLKPEVIRQLLSVFECHSAAIVRPRYDGKPGSPVIFPIHLAGELCGISGDDGGRQVIRKHPEIVVVVDISDEKQGVDVDDPQEAAHWLGLGD